MGTKRAPRINQAAPAPRGVTGILAMMFLILFSSLAAAMAVMSKGNLRAAETHARVSRAQAAVDTGLQIAESRLNEAAARFLVAKGEITTAYAGQLWNGTYPGSPAVTVLNPPDGRVESGTAVGIADAISMHHQSDAAPNLISPITLGSAPSGWVRALPIVIETNDSGEAVNCVQIDYAAPDGLGRVRVIATGYEWDWLRNRWITRTAQQHFTISKTLTHAIISPSRIMLGKNVNVNGPLGVRYNSSSLDTMDGPPLHSISDFAGMDAQLDVKLAAFRAAVLADDVDGDNRLRINHPTESRSLGGLNAMDFDGDSAADHAYQDYTMDDRIDEYDIFLKHYDVINGTPPNAVVLSAALTNGTPASGQTPEFTLDDALAYLIDGSVPDRNGNGKWNGRLVNGVWDFSTFPDNNKDGVLDENDIDHDDIALGYRDGVLDYRDQYAKVHGSVYFKAQRNAWEASRDEFGVLIADYQKLVEGTIRPKDGDLPVKFNASDAEVPQFTAESFAEAATVMGQFSGSSGVSSDNFATIVSPQAGDEWIIESVPYGSPAPADWYRRPVYRNLTFRNTTIPQGTNALFINCTFVGVTKISTMINNTHASFGFYGEQSRNVNTGALETKYPLSADSTIALDERWCEFLDCSGITPQPTFMADIDNDGDVEECLNSKLVSNNIRFHDCIFIGGIVADKPQIFTHVRNKLTFTGATKFVTEHPTEPNNPAYQLTDSERAITKKSSMMLPHYSVDIGSNNSSAAQDIRLNGAIIAGVLDVRGNAEINGALLLTYKPEYGSAPLAVYGTPAGNPQAFNVTLGYFGPEQGDDEGIDLSLMVDLDGNGSLDVGWDSARNSDGALIPVGTSPELESWYDGVPDTDAIAGTHIRRAIPFNGFGRITLNLDTNIVLPDGLSAPINIRALRSTYLEGKIAAVSYED